MKKRTKILATIGPASDSQEMLEALMHAGVNLFRMNFSHGSHEYHSKVLNRIRLAIENTGLIVGILQDISGPKIRVGMLDYDFELESGDVLEFVKDEITGEKIEDGQYKLCINQNSILDMLSIDEHIYLADGALHAVIIEKSSNGIKARMENSGVLSSRKGVNFPNTRLGIEVITPKDREDMKWGVENDVDFMAISFVQSADDMIEARKIIKSHGGSTQLFAKIEKFEAVEDMKDIIKASDGIMVARGDLGIEVPYYEVPFIQKSLIRRANECSKPVITATQMLLSMTQNERATRAEISDVANAVLDGTDVVMLSEESAVGHNPVLAVQTMFNTIRATEKDYPFHKYNHFENMDDTDSIDEATVKLSHELDVDAILAITSSGQSANKIARYRPAVPIYGVTTDEKVARALTAVWGVVPAFSVKPGSLGHTMKSVVEQGLEKNVLDLEKSYILTAGDPVGVAGKTNMIRLLRKNEMKFIQTLPIDENI